MYVYIYIHTHIYIYIYVYVYMYIYTCMYVLGSMCTCNDTEESVLHLYGGHHANLVFTHTYVHTLMQTHAHV